VNLDHPSPGVSITFGWKTGDIDGESAGGEEGEEEEEEEEVVRLNSGCTGLDHTPSPGLESWSRFGWSTRDTGDYGLLALLFALFVCLRQIRSIRTSLN
jgi:hypothetical protein